MSLVGHTIQQYRVLEQLGQGGMAVVYKAYDTRLEREVAIKVIRRADIPESQYERFLKRFEQEARVQARFNHPNIVKVHDYGEHEGAPYLVMEYQSGGTLKQFTGKPMPVAQAAALIAPIASALAYAHERKILHRDVKPSNILIDEHSTPLLTDFGIAKIFEGGEGTGITGLGLGVGTPAYMALEQRKGKPVPQSDVYGLGVVLYELVTGHVPYEAETPDAVLVMQATEPLPSPRQFVPDLTPASEKAILKALTKNPEDRYESMGAFRDALEKLATGRRKPSSNKPAEHHSIDDTTRDELDNQKPEKVQKKPSDSSLKSLIGFILIGFGLLAALIVSQMIRPSISDTQGQTGVAPTMAGSSQAPTIFSQDQASPAPTGTITSAPSVTDTPAPTAPPSFGVGSSFINPIDGARLLYIPAGEFQMGSNNGDSDEQPIHTVYLDAYWMYETEVTNAQFAQFVAETGQSGLGSGSDDSLVQHPVKEVNWDDAAAYCEWAGGRLPTEAEWEKASRGTDGRTYPWGDTWMSSLANSIGSGDDGYDGTAPVGSFPDGASPYGLLDMAGNVLEWTADKYGFSYYVTSPFSNPPGPVTGEFYVLRGRSWFLSEDSLRVTDRFFEWSDRSRRGIRYGNVPDNMLDYIGFRCASSISP